MDDRLKSELIREIHEFLDRRWPRSEDGAPAITSRRLQLASAVLMVSVVRADLESRQDEHRALEGAVGRALDLHEEAAAVVVRVAEEALELGVSFGELLQQLARECSLEQKRQLVESLWVSKELGLNRFVTEQPPYNLLDRRIERELIPAAQTYGFGVIPWSPLAGGFLSGKYKRQGPQPEGRFADGTHVRAAGLLGNPRAFDAVEALEGVAREKGVPLSQLALAWTIQQPGITSPIIGPRTLEQLEDNLKALDLTLTEQDRARIDAISPPGRAIVPLYEAAFGPNARWQ